MWDIFISLFVITALALMFAHAWTAVAETALATWEIKDDEGNVKAPVIQTFTYAICITIISLGVLFVVHRYTTIDLAAGHQKLHRKKIT